MPCSCAALLAVRCSACCVQTLKWWNMPLVKLLLQFLGIGRLGMAAAFLGSFMHLHVVCISPREHLSHGQASVGTYREFVVFDASQIYPEYVILYEREF